MKYEAKHTEKTTHIRHEPENVINVTIVKQTLPADDQQHAINDEKPKQQQSIVETEPHKIDTETQTIDNNREKIGGKVKSTKKILQLSKQIKTRNTNVVFKRTSAHDGHDGILVRNTPTDLYHKYKSDWAKFKSYIPGENSRQSVRDSVRARMHHKVDDPPQVCDFSFIFASKYH